MVRTNLLRKVQKVPTKGRMNLNFPLCAFVLNKKQKPLPVLITEVDEQGAAKGYRNGDAAKFPQGTWLVDVPEGYGEPTWEELLGER